MTLLLWLLIPLAAADPPPAVHASIERQFTFLGSTRTTSYESWTTADKTCEKRSDAARIERRDLGLTWRVNFKEKQWLQEAAPTQRETPKVDVHSLGFDYQPRFVWTLKEAQETRTIAGRKCALAIATGIADYAETVLRLWFCQTIDAPAEARLSQSLVSASGSAYEDITRFLNELLHQRAAQVLLAIEETTDPPISPLMVRKTEVRTLENAPAPEGIFDLPKDFKKLEAR